MAFPLLSVIVFLPLLGAIVLAGVPREQANAVRWVALVVMLVTFGISLALYPLFEPALPGMQLSERVAWISSVGIFYHIGVDGISLPLVLLTTFLSPIAFLGAWQQHHHQGQRVCHVHAAAGDRHAGGLSGAGSVPVFYLLGSHADPHVLYHWHLGG